MSFQLLTRPPATTSNGNRRTQPLQTNGLITAERNALPNWSFRMLRQTVQFAFHNLGGLGFIRWKNRGGLRILMYHRFPQPHVLKAHCEHLRKHYHPVSMSQVVTALDSGDALPPNACAITVDDGFRDFFEIAQPILSVYRIPATVFVVTDFLDGSLWLWGDRVKYAFLHTPLQAIGFGVSGREFHFDLSSPSRRSKAAFEVKEHCKQITQEERLAWIAGLQRLLQVSIPEDPPPEFRPLQWADVRALAKQGVEFGA